MGKRRTRAELRSEYVRLLGIWTHVRTALVELLEDESAHVTESLPQAESLLAQFDAQVIPAGELVRSMDATLREMAVGYKAGLRDNEPTSKAFLSRYSVLSMRDFFADVGDPHHFLNSVIQQEALRDDIEYYAVKAEIDDNAKILSAAGRRRGAILIDDFERRARS